MKLVFATNNPNKVQEVQAMISSGIQLLSLADIGCTVDIPETSSTIEGNAIQKVQYVKERYGYDCFADDTGLEVDILDGEPGVYSARYAGKAKDSDANMCKLLEKLKEQENRNAHFKTVIALSINGNLETFTGICQGKITKYKRGDQGFGYDPIFLPNGFDKTFAELSLEQKNSISHRALAIKQLVAFLSS